MTMESLASLQAPIKHTSSAPCTSSTALSPFSRSSTTMNAWFEQQIAQSVPTARFLLPIQPQQLRLQLGGEHKKRPTIFTISPSWISLSWTFWLNSSTSCNPGRTSSGSSSTSLYQHRTTPQPRRSWNATARIINSSHSPTPRSSSTLSTTSLHDPDADSPR